MPIGNAQTIGRREVQSNYFATEYNDTGDLLAVLADGTIDHLNGRKAAIMAVEHCINSFLRSSLNEHTERFMVDIALNINKRIKDAVYIGRSPRLSLTVVLLSGETAHYFNVGANKILFYAFNEREDRKMKFVIKLFLPVDYPYVVHWGYTYGSVGHDESMVLEKFVL